MEYTIKELSELSGLTPRTLRYYHQIGLLNPAGIRTSGYRFYGAAEVDRLQQILFFRELGFSLEKIKELLDNPDFNREATLQSHLIAIRQQRDRLDRFILNLQNTILALKGESKMDDKQKFEGLKQQMIDDNEAKYGEEIREKYGDKIVDASNDKIKNMTKEQMGAIGKLTSELNEILEKALATGDPKGILAQKACELHKDWICFYWPEGKYTPKAHMGLADMYCQDPRFRDYYEKIGTGCAKFLRDAIYEYCGGTPSIQAEEPSRKTFEVDEYIGQFPQEVQETLHQLRDLILKEAPKAKEKMSYGMPTYAMKKNLIHFAGYKNHIGLYPQPDGIEAFQQELTPYKTSKGAIQFPLNKPMPWTLIQRIIQNRVANGE